jgi:predicted nucleic acid-binding protein
VIWQLHPNLTSYDAAYVALAEALGLALVAPDRRVQRAAGIGCTVELTRDRCSRGCPWQPVPARQAE